MNTPQQQLREKINKACPELLRLKQGCEVRDDVGVKVICVGIDTNDNWLFYYPTLNLVRNLEPRRRKIIIGTPPTLEHLLRAIGAQKAFTLVTAYPKTAIKVNGKKPIWYDLNKSPVNQSDETTEALLELLQ